MPKFFVKDDQIKNNKIEIIDEDVNHIVNVLRCKIGENLNIANIDTGKNYESEIEKIDKNSVICKIKREIESSSESNINIDILQGLPKADKMELIIQKSTELGAKEITPVNMERCIVKINAKDESKKINRWQKIAEVAAKQSRRDIIPKVNNIINLAVVIGPEGGFAESEIENLTNIGCKIITLGKRILRTETVALVMTSIILYELENN